MESKHKRPLLRISADRINQHFQRLENWFKEIHQKKERQPPCKDQLRDELSILTQQKSDAEDKVKEMMRENQVLQNEVLQLRKQLMEERKQGKLSKAREVASQTKLPHKLLEAELQQHDRQTVLEENVQIQGHSVVKNSTKRLWPFRWFVKR